MADAIIAALAACWVELGRGLERMVAYSIYLGVPLHTKPWAYRRTVNLIHADLVASWRVLARGIDRMVPYSIYFSIL